MLERSEKTARDGTTCQLRSLGDAVVNSTDGVPTAAIVIICTHGNYSTTITLTTS